MVGEHGVGVAERGEARRVGVGERPRLSQTHRAGYCRGEMFRWRDNSEVFSAEFTRQAESTTRSCARARRGRARARNEGGRTSDSSVLAGWLTARRGQEGQPLRAKTKWVMGSEV